MVENSIMHSFSGPASCAEKCLQQQLTIWWKTRDATKRTSLGGAVVSPGVADRSLAVTNNSPVWRPQGAHGGS